MTQLRNALTRVMSALLIVSIQLYRMLISPLIGPSCRFLPSCSQYALDAIRVHGPFLGSWLAIKRIGRCHPLHPGGLDPVPRPGERVGP